MHKASFTVSTPRDGKFYFATLEEAVSCWKNYTGSSVWVNTTGCHSILLNP